MFEGTDLELAVGEFTVQVLDATLVFLCDFAELSQLSGQFRVDLVAHGALIGLASGELVGVVVGGLGTVHGEGFRGGLDYVCERRVLWAFGDWIAGELTFAAEDIGGARFAGRLGAVGVPVDVLRERFMVVGGFYGQRLLRVEGGVIGVAIILYIGGLFDLRVTKAGDVDIIGREVWAEQESLTNGVGVTGELNVGIWDWMPVMSTVNSGHQQTKGLATHFAIVDDGGLWRWVLRRGASKMSFN